MLFFSRPMCALWLAIAVAWLPASAALADADAREINAYRLTDAGLRKYMQATRNVARLDSAIPGDCAGDDDENVTSIDAAVVKLNSTPGASRAIQAAGMSPREWVVFSMSVLQAGLAAWALDQPGGTLPPEVSMANVDFYRKNQAVMQKFSDETRAAGCEDEDANDS